MDVLCRRVSALIFAATCASLSFAACEFALFTPLGVNTPGVATRDGLVLQRYARGINDSTLIANVQSGTQTANDTINKINSRPSLDVTCKGQFDGTDATIIARHLKGFRDERLTDGLTLTGQRNTTQLVQQYLDNACVSGLTCATSAVPGGLYVGYYNEDPTNNPEDPTIGALYMRLPQGNSAFSGNMYFTYSGCQNQNVGTITGNKNQLSLAANWSGTIDNLAQSGTMTGQFQPALGIYQGTYTNAGGKQFRDLSPCVVYYIAAFGAWELFPVGQTFSTGGASQAASVSGNTVSWQAPVGTIACLVSAIDQLATQGGGGNAIVWQQVVIGTTLSVAIPTTALQSGRSYVASVACTASASLQRNYFSSAAFVYN